MSVASFLIRDSRLEIVGGLPTGGPFRGENRSWSPADVVALWSPCEGVSWSDAGIRAMGPSVLL
jgi:hypothetical protein